MSVKHIKDMLTLSPELSFFVKKAHVENEYATSSKEDTLAAALQIEYMVKVAHEPVDYDVVTRVKQAVALYELEDQVQELSGGLLKKASLRAEQFESLKSEVAMAEQIIEGNCSGLAQMDKIAEQSEALFDGYEEHVSSPTVRLYAGAGVLNKEAALAALSHRAHVTGKNGFSKIAQVIDATDVSKLSVSDNRAIVNSIQRLEKEANYHASDIYKDIFMIEKSAIDKSIMVDLGSKKVPAIRISAIPKETINDTLGITLSSDLMNMKAEVEALPLPEKKLLARLL